MKITRMDFPDFEKSRVSLNTLFGNLPVWAGNAGLNFFLDSWRRRGFIDKSFERWEERKATDQGNKRGLLIGKGSGRLRRSLKLRTGEDWFEVYTDNPYAKSHNEGEKTTQIPTAKQRRFFWAKYYQLRKRNPKEARKWKAMALAKKLTIVIPKRQFMGASQFFDRRVQLHVERGISNAIKF